MIRQRNARTLNGAHVQRRTIFNFGSMFGKKREPAEANMTPGLDKMMELEKMTRLKARLPPPEDVAAALYAFARNGAKGRTGLEDNQAQLYLQSMQYCLRCEAERKADGDETTWLLPTNTLIHAAWALRKVKGSLTDSHIELAKALYETARSRGDHRSVVKIFLIYVRLLALNRSPQQALNVVEEFERSAVPKGAPPSQSQDEASEGEQEEMEYAGELSRAKDLDRHAVAGVALNMVLRGFVSLGPHEMIPPTLTMVREHGIPIHDVAATMSRFSLQQNDFPSALDWWRELRSTFAKEENLSIFRQREMDNLAQTLLDWCLNNNEIEAGHRIVEELTASNPSKRVWDIIFVWAASTKKSVDEIDRMIDVMVQSNKSITDRTDWRLPDVDTINALVEFAMSRDDPYMAERLITMGREKDIEPDAKTYALQMSYRLRINDVDGALVAYMKLQGLDLSSNDDVPAVNRLIVALCNTGRHDFDTIMNVAADLSDRRVRFEAETVATLSLLHLRRDERFDVIDLLNTHAYHFSSVERENIRNKIIAFALDPDTPVALSWDAYTILREHFDEMPRTQRTEMMNDFIRRERPDMGVHVFQNMRMHSRADTMPTIDTYVAAFMSLAQARELESLEIVHNQLKLDYNINLSTYLRNALIIAYTACEQPRSALDFWDEIAASREGPSYNSVHVALRACEKAPFGDLKAQDIWNLLRKRGVELDQSFWASYIAALAGNGDNELALHALEQGVERGEVEVDEFLLGSLFMAGVNKEKQGEIEGWAVERFPEVWEELVGKGVETNLAGVRTLKGIDRSVAP